MKDLMFFDANAVVGNTLKGVKPGCAELLKEMDRNGVDKALVRHGNMAAAGVLITNREISSMLKDAASDRLYGVWGILPSQCNELPAGKEFFEAMKFNNIKALRKLFFRASFFNIVQLFYKNIFLSFIVVCYF